MSNGYLAVALAYTVFAVTLYRFEAHRTRRGGADAITIFMVLFVLQCCLAGVLIYATLPFVDPDSPTEVPAFDRILQRADLTTAFVVLCMSIWFVVFFYVGAALTRALLPRPALVVPLIGTHSLRLRVGPLVVVIMLGMSVTLYSFMQLGDDMLTRYANLVLYRAQEGDIERNALNANALALTQTWAWLTVAAIFCVFAVGRWRWLLPVALAGLLVLALLGVSRRALFIPVLMLYLMSVLHDRRWRLRWVAASALPLLLVLAFGKNMFAAIGASGTVETTAGYESVAGALLRAASDLGITIVESLGTLQFLDVGPRFGVDHLIAMVQIFPEKSLGIEVEFPERIVRISTEAFDGADAQDIPPGLMGQMWLDFRALGPIVWGLAFGCQMAIVQFLFERLRRTRHAAAVAVLVVFVIALPLNTGSMDFTFSVDIVALAFVLLLCVRVRREFCRQARLRVLPIPPAPALDRDIRE
jgi:hypothetical protein